MFLRVGVVPESVMELDSMETTKHMVEAGLGIAILPVVSVDRDVETARCGASKSVTWSSLPSAKSASTSCATALSHPRFATS